MKNNKYVFGENSQLAKELKIASCFGNNAIAKSEIGYAFSNSNPDMNSLKFNKKGEDLIKMFLSKKEALQSQLSDIEVQKAAIKTKLVEGGVEFKKNIGDNYDQATYNYDSTPEDIRNLCYQYNSNYVCERLVQEIKTCQALIDNLDEKKTYNLSTPQLLSLQKAMEFDIMKAEGSKGGKIIGHTATGKPIYDHFTHPSHKDFTPKEHDEASSLHEDFSFKQNPHQKDFLSDSKNKKIAHHDEQSDKHYDAAKKSDDSDIQKAEGSKGGKVIGHTKSGKAIYDSAGHNSHKNFSIAEHDDAIKAHEKVSEKHSEENKRYIEEMVEAADKGSGGMSEFQQAKESANKNKHHREQVQAHVGAKNHLMKDMTPAEAYAATKESEEKNKPEGSEHKVGDEVEYEGKKYKAGKHDPSTNLRYLHDKESGEHAEDSKGDKLQVHESKVKSDEKKHHGKMSDHYGRQSLSASTTEDKKRLQDLADKHDKLSKSDDSDIQRAFEILGL